MSLVWVSLGSLLVVLLVVVVMAVHSVVRWWKVVPSSVASSMPHVNVLAAHAVLLSRRQRRMLRRGGRLVVEVGTGRELQCNYFASGYVKAEPGVRLHVVPRLAFERGRVLVYGDPRLTGKFSPLSSQVPPAALCGYFGVQPSGDIVAVYSGEEPIVAVTVTVRTGGVEVRLVSTGEEPADEAVVSMPVGFELQGVA